MNNEQKAVLEFHKAFNCLIANKPAIPDVNTAKLRISLIQEELNELEKAFADRDIVEIADAIGDLLYVVYGSAVSCGIDAEPIFEEIQRSNMTKVGGWVREDGKYMKPSTYSPTNLLPILEDQGFVR